MTAHHERHDRGALPPMRTLAELRTALGRWGFPDDLEQFERELSATDLDDLIRVREIVQAYRHRVVLQADPQATAAVNRSIEDVTDELRRKMQEAGAR